MLAAVLITVFIVLVTVAVLDARRQVEKQNLIAQLPELLAKYDYWSHRSKSDGLAEVVLDRLTRQLSRAGCTV